ncbi:MAG: HD domain-containing protein, partial [Syntrophales bacterium]|nr:HD domain-containing protein [Syntrophales bacterium]
MGRRVTIAFTLFGLIIGYLVFITFFVYATQDFVRFSTEVIETSLQNILPEESDRLARLLGREEAELTAVSNFISALSSKFFNIRGFDIYYKKDDDGRWYHFFIDKQKILQAEPVGDANLIAGLEECLRMKFVSASGWFFGQEDVVNVKSHITRPMDRHRYVLSIDIDRHGLGETIRENSWKIGIFGLVLLFTSVMLGFLFRLRLITPIEALSREASAMARGDFNREFKTGEKDEIGVLAAALNSAALRVRTDIREKEELLLGTLLALSRSIDAKSAWTAGHSERVMGYAELIGSDLGLDASSLKRLKICAILHDMGKIAVPGHILDKAGRLTEEEFDTVKRHPAVGADIISPITAYGDVTPGVRHHHERWDGQGYPDGLKGDDIPR